VVLWRRGAIPLGVGFAVNSLVAYAFYTVHHDATHKSISGRRAKWRWLDVVCGNIAGMVMILDFSGYAANHLRHHAHTNTAADPDILVKGPMSALPLKWFLSNVFAILGCLPRGSVLVVALMKLLRLPVPDATSTRDQGDTKRVLRLVRLSLIALVVSVPFGVFWPVFLLWWLPSRVGILLLVVLFQWLPHFPFDRTDRFGATRINRFPGSTFVLLQQDRHLIHHLYPQIPWFRYGAAHRRLKEFLAARGAVIEGSGTAPHVPVRLKQAITS
jgi:beta-carotene hydroxylase